MNKGEVEDFNISPCFTCHDSAAFPSAPSVAVQGEKEDKKAIEISLCWFPEHGACACVLVVKSSSLNVLANWCLDERTKLGPQLVCWNELENGHSVLTLEVPE